jgi:hypothetical protein
MAPLTGRYFLVNKKLQYWVRIWEDGMTITNHKFTFSHSSPQLFQSKLVRIVETAIEKSRDEFENAIFQNEVELLQSISDSITDTKL